MSEYLYWNHLYC